MTALKFLLVEDDVYLVRGLKRQIEELGYQVIGTAGNMLDAMDIFSEKNPDIVIMDIELTDHKEGGILLAKKFKEKEDIPIIYFTSFVGQKEIIKKAIGTAPDVILSKSADIEELLANIDNSIEKNIREKAYDSENDLEFKKDKSSFWIKSRDRYDRIFFNDICWLQTDGGYMKIVTENQEKTFTTTLSFFEKNMKNEIFQRTHLSHIINFDKAVGIKLTERVIILMRNHLECAIPISDTYYDKLKNRMNIMKTRKIK